MRVRADRTLGAVRPLWDDLGVVDDVVYVLGGGGRLGAAEVGMLSALAEAGIRPDRVLGTSIGAINGAAAALDPTPEGIATLRAMWEGLDRAGCSAGG